MSEPTWKRAVIAPSGTHHLLDGEPLYAARFEAVLKFHEPGLAPVLERSGAYHITPDGLAAYPQRYLRTFGFYEGLAAAVSEAGWLHVTPKGDAAYPEHYAWCGNYQGGRCTVRAPDGSYLHLGLDGRPVYTARWSYAGDFRDSVAVVQRGDGLHTHIDEAGDPIHGHWFSDLDVFHKGFARARDERGWTHVDTRGRPTYQRRFAAVEPFYNGQARVERTDVGLEVIDEQGATVLVLREAPSRASWSGSQDEVLLNHRYRLDPEAPVARSSHGAIWPAQDIEDGQDVLIKSSSCGDGHRRELHALQVLQGHPCAPRLRDHFPAGQSHYLVMEIAQGKQVGGRSRCRSMGIEVALQIVAQAADLSERLHQAGLVHTDLHPGNLLLDSVAAQAKVTVLDYEFTVPVGEDGCWRGEVHWGRWEFVPPEQFEGFRELDATADTYALAGLFCFYALGHAPFHIDFATHRSEGWAAVRRAFLATRSSPDLAGLPEGLRPPLSRALSIDRMERFQRASHLLEALSVAVENRRI